MVLKSHLSAESFMTIIFPTGLWTRLSLRKNFLLALDDSSKNFIWEVIRNDSSIEVFLMEDPRPPLVIFNRYDYLDPELETICEPVSHT